MKKTIAATAIAAAALTTATPAEAWPGYSYVYHGPVGNDALLNVYCKNGAGPYGLQQGYASTYVCGNGGDTSALLIWGGYGVRCRPMGASGGYTKAWNGPSSPTMPDGSWYCWTVRL